MTNMIKDLELILCFINEMNGMFFFSSSSHDKKKGEFNTSIK